MQKLRFLPLAAMTLALSLFTGCDEEDGTVTINGFSVSNAKPEAGTSIDARGTADFETDGATVTYSVSGTNASSVIEVPAPFKVSGSGASIGKQISIKSGATGTYTLSVKVVDEDGIEATASTTFCVGSCGGVIPQDLLSKGSVTLGAQSAAEGSFLQLTGDVAAWTSGDGKPVNDIYVVFGQDGANVLSLMSPDQADGDGFSLGWSNLNSAKIADLGTTMPANKAAVASALASTTAEKAAAVAGHYYGVKYGTTATYSVVYITTINPATRSAKASVTIYQ